MRLPWQRGGDEADEIVVRSAAAARDEQLSEYLDGFLSRPDRATIEVDAARDSDVRLALEGMRAVRASLGELGMVRAPRSFAIAPQEAPRQFGLPRMELYMRFATVAAALVLTATTLVPSFTGGVEERAATSMAESFDAAQAPADARKQAADQSAPPAQATAAARAAATTVAAPALEGAPAAGGATQAAPAAQPSSAVPPRTGAPAPEGAASAPAALPPVSEQPVPLSNGAADSSRSAWWGAQFASAVATAVLAAAALWLWLRRRAAGGV